MSAVTGPPDELDERRAELTPMLQQYVDCCREHDDALVLFRVGDFYKTFCEIAEAVARICELTLIEREDSTGTYAAAGIPVDNAAEYLDRLLDEGHRIAIADQVEEPSEVNGLADRAVTQVITPGTVVDDELLSPDSTYLAAVVADEGDPNRAGGSDEGDPNRAGGSDEGDPNRAGGSDEAEYAVASVDVSTGECRVTSAASREAVAEELERVAPAELLEGPGEGFDVPCPTTVWEEEAFSEASARETLASYTEPDRFSAVEVRAVGGLLAYAEYTQGDEGALEYVSRVGRYDPAEHLQLDGAALRSLELFENRARGDRRGDTLFDVVDETTCALGRRRLEAWLRRPLVDRAKIEARHEAVAELSGATLLREELRDQLSTAYDLERLVSRVSRERANARDLRSVADTLAVVPEIRGALEDADAPLLAELREDLDELGDVRDLLDRAIVDDPPQEITEGGIVRDGFDTELDEVRATEREGREWVADLEQKERERTGIENLEVGHNQVHGYYIEVTNSHLDSVPEEYQRRQTLKNAERFVTPALREREDEILRAAERADSLEYEVFCEVRTEVADATGRLQGLADALGRLDALLSLSVVAVGPDWAQPEFHSEGDPDRAGGSDGDDPLEIEAGRHPVVARAQPEFVPNGVDLPAESVALVTGPNMSGKSTYMRQVGLIVVLAQAGGFVPAESASLPVVDRVFTRVGASDDIAGGQSTFMREMSELTDILHDATEDSLVLLDEVGRGTSTADGTAIARAATEFLHDEVGARTMFATHYHDLTALADEREGVFNLHFTAIRDGDDVTFLHRVDEGPSSSSYGIEVARMAGVPDPVVERSRDLVEDGADDGTAAATADTERDEPESEPDIDDAPDSTKAATNGGQQTLPGIGDDEEDELLAELRSMDLAHTTPLEALNRLHELQERAEQR